MFPKKILRCGENTKAHVIEAMNKLATYSVAADPRADFGEARMALSYLDAFGYLSSELAQWKDITLGDIVNAVTDFQKTYGLKPSGQLDAPTVRAMQAPRCGLSDHQADPMVKKLQAFAASNLARWQKTGITYAVQQYVPGLPITAQDQIIAAAFADWCAVCNININRVTGGNPDIVIGVGQGPRSNFDGPGGVLAWAYLPDGSDKQLLMEFDQDETWASDPSQRGTLMKNVATHEFGHLLGLSHSVVQSALMAPYYAAGIATPQQNDDIPRVVARYGPPQGGPVTPPVTPPPPVVPPAPPPVTPPVVPPVVPPVQPPSTNGADTHTITIQGSNLVISVDGMPWVG